MAPAGRPRTFDRDAALIRAMHVFWEKGYEGTTMADLIETIGVKAPGVYAAFGNKDALFKESVEVYSKLYGIRPVSPLLEEDSIYEAISNSLKANVDTFTSPNNPASCLIFCAANNCTAEHIEHEHNLRNLRKSYKGIYENRFARAIEDGELVEGANSKDLAEFFMTFVHGMAMMAKDGATAIELTNSCKLALNLLKMNLKISPA